MFLLFHRFRYCEVLENVPEPTLNWIENSKFGVRVFPEMFAETFPIPNISGGYVSTPPRSLCADETTHAQS